MPKSAIRLRAAVVAGVTAATAVAAAWSAGAPATAPGLGWAHTGVIAGVAGASSKPAARSAIPATAAVQVRLRRTADGHAHETGTPLWIGGALAEDAAAQPQWVEYGSAVAEDAAAQPQWVEYGSAGYVLCIRKHTREA